MEQLSTAENGLPSQLRLRRIPDLLSGGLRNVERSVQDPDLGDFCSYFRRLLDSPELVPLSSLPQALRQRMVVAHEYPKHIR